MMAAWLPCKHPYNRTSQATIPAATISTAKARTGLTSRGAAASSGISFIPVSIGRTKFCCFSSAYKTIAMTCSTIASSLRSRGT